MLHDPNLEDFSSGALKQAFGEGTLEGLVRSAGLALDEVPWSTFVEAAIELHRRGEIDLLSSAAAGIGPIDYFVERLYLEALPELDVGVERMLTFVNALMPRARDGTIPHFLYDAFSNWARKDPRRVDVSFVAISAGTAPQALRIATLQAGLHAARERYLPIVLSLLGSENVEEVRASGFVIGTIQAVGDEIASVNAALAAGWTSDFAPTRLATLGAALALGTREGGGEMVALSALDALEPNNSAQVRQAIANAMFLAQRRLSEPMVSRMCDLLRATEPDEAETVEAINHAIAQHLSGPTAPPRLALLADLLRRGVGDLETMDDTAHYILTNKDGLLRTLVTQWIADGSDRLISAVDDLVKTPASDHAITFDLDFSSHALAAEQTLAAGRKVVARLILFPETVTSILLSLMRTGHPDAAQGLEDLLFDPLLISYWEGPRAYLMEALAAQSSLIRKRIERVIGRLDNYVAAIRDAGVLAELGPPERQRFLREVLRLEDRCQMEKGIRRKSVLADLFPTRAVLYGDSVVTEVYRADGEAERQEFRLGRIETSMPLARLDAIDPFGFWYQRVLLSMGKMP